MIVESKAMWFSIFSSDLILQAHRAVIASINAQRFIAARTSALHQMYIRSAAIGVNGKREYIALFWKAQLKNTSDAKPKLVV